jgi:hypothetical protein
LELCSLDDGVLRRGRGRLWGCRVDKSLIWFNIGNSCTTDVILGWLNTVGLVLNVYIVESCALSRLADVGQEETVRESCHDVLCREHILALCDIFCRDISADINEAFDIPLGNNVKVNDIASLGSIWPSNFIVADAVVAELQVLLEPLLLLDCDTIGISSYVFRFAANEIIWATLKFEAQLIRIISALLSRKRPALVVLDGAGLRATPPIAPYSLSYAEILLLLDALMAIVRCAHGCRL